jgi:Na+/H+ antiporter NhaD/arsenite permease-like protein
MFIALIVVFVIGYLGIVFEHKISVDKTASAILTGVVLWVLAALGQFGNHATTTAALMHNVSEIAGILFFLMAAMTMVELIDAHDGFDIISNFIRTTRKVSLLWIICLITFFLSALLDNLTTTIIMVALVRKLIFNKEERLFFVGLIIIAANAGGAWSPIGDVTTTMLWIGGQITSMHLMSKLFFPSLVSLLVPLAIISLKMKGHIKSSVKEASKNGIHLSTFEKNLVLLVGLLGLVFVPIFKTITHLPPFMGILFSLGVLWLVTERIQKNKDHHFKSTNSVLQILKNIDLASILFFLGILLAVGALQYTGILTATANWLSQNLGNENIIVIAIGMLSAIVDNVPLVAAAMGMYNMETFGTDHNFWTLLAFCAGTGGSLLIIGSAAGVAAMGIEKIEFFWYFKHITWLAFLGYFAGIACYLLQQSLFS